jgi:endonuclease-3 related protein
MPSFSTDFDEIVLALEASYGDPGPEGTPPPSGSFRDVLLVFLGEQKGAKGGQAIDRLDRAGWSLDPPALAEVDPGELADALREGRARAPDGLVSALKRLAAWVVGRGGMDGISKIPTESLRDDLRAIRGIGAASADRILRDALDRPTFPVSRADYRIMIRHGWIDPSSDYDEARSVIEDASPSDPAELRRLGAWFGRLARPCKVAAPQCDRCPLQPFLPEGGPLDPS